MIIHEVTRSEFHKLMRDDFGYEACDFLYQYYEDISYDIGENVTFDRVAIRCDWGEYESLEKAKEDWPGLEEEQYHVIENGVVMVEAH